MGIRARPNSADDAEADTIPATIWRLKTAFHPADYARAERALVARDSSLKREIEKLRNENAKLVEADRFRELEMLRLRDEAGSKDVIGEQQRRIRELERQKLKLEGLVQSEYEGWKGLISKLEGDVKKLRGVESGNVVVEVKLEKEEDGIGGVASWDSGNDAEARAFDCQGKLNNAVKQFEEKDASLAALRDELAALKDKYEGTLVSLEEQQVKAAEAETRAVAAEAQASELRQLTQQQQARIERLNERADRYKRYGVSQYLQSAEFKQWCLDYFYESIDVVTEHLANLGLYTDEEYVSRNSREGVPIVLPPHENPQSICFISGVVGFPKLSSEDAGLIERHNECAPKETEMLCEISEMHKDTESLGVTGVERKPRVPKRKSSSSLSGSDDENSNCEIKQRQKLRVEPELLDFSGSNVSENQKFSNQEQVNLMVSEVKIMAEQKSPLFHDASVSLVEVSTDSDNDPSANLSSSSSSSSSDSEDDDLLLAQIDQIIPEVKNKRGRCSV